MPSIYVNFGYRVGQVTGVPARLRLSGPPDLASTRLSRPPDASALGPAFCITVALQRFHTR
jgi:hypothetical protein